MAPTAKSQGYQSRAGAYTIRLYYHGDSHCVVNVRAATHEKGDTQERVTVLLERELGRQPTSLWEAVQVLIWAAKQLDGKPYPGAPDV